MINNLNYIDSPKSGISKLNIKDPREKRSLLRSKYNRIINYPSKIDEVDELINELTILNNKGGKKDKNKYIGMIGILNKLKEHGYEGITNTKLGILRKNKINNLKDHFTKQILCIL